MLEKPNPIQEGLDAAAGTISPRLKTRPLEEYQGRPLDFMIEILGVSRETLVWSDHPAYDGHQWDGELDPFVLACDAVARFDNCGIQSGIGTGKTFWLAGLVLYFVGCYRNSIVATCAPRKDQLMRRVWKEIRKMWPAFESRFPNARYMDSGEIRMLPGNSLEWCAYADVAGVRSGELSTTRVQGEHAEYMLIITEETPGVAPAHMVAFQNTCVGPYNIQVAVGNPDYSGDQLAEFCGRQDVEDVRISCLDHPNVVRQDPGIVPGATTLDWVEKRFKQWHEQMPHMYESRVRGLSPEVAIGAVYEYREAKHTSAWTYEYAKKLLARGEATVLVGVDTGVWRFAQVIGVLDSADRLHVVKELWSSQETTDTRMQALIDELRNLKVDPQNVYIYHDPGGGVDTTDLRAAMKRCGWEGRLVQKGSKAAVKGADNQRVRWKLASYQRIGDLLARGQLLFARDLSHDLEWEIGASTKQRGKKKVGSRLIWEFKNLRYQEAKDGKAQRDEPDEGTADGADMLAALRFVAMQVSPRHRPLTQTEAEELDRQSAELSESFARTLPFNRRNLPPQKIGNRDYGLERITAMRERMEVSMHPDGARVMKKIAKRERARRRVQEERARREHAEELDRRSEEQKKDRAALGAGGRIARFVEAAEDEDAAIDELLGIEGLTGDEGE